MTAIVVKSFNGLKPITDPRLLDQSEAQTAENVRLISGAIYPLRKLTTLMASVLAAPKTIYRYGSSVVESEYWCEFAADTSVMRSPIANDQWDRLYWTNGVDAPRYAPNSLILQEGSGPYPRASYQLGIPAPSSQPSITSFKAVVYYDSVKREYVMTFYNPTTDKESVASSVWSVTGVDGQKVEFSELTTDNLGDAGITKKRIYRKVDDVYRRIVELDLEETKYDDEATDASLADATQLPTALSSVTAPEVSPTVTAGTATTTVPATQRNYVFTVKTFSQPYTSGDTTTTMYYVESGPSNAVALSADSTQTVTLSGFNANVVGGGSGTHYRIYRKDADESSYRFLAEIPVSQSTYADVISTSQLGLSLQYDAPAASKSTGTLSASANESTALTAVKRIYMVTFVDASGNESKRSPVSSIVSVFDGQTPVTISHYESLPSGIKKKRLYRQTVTVTDGVLDMSDADWKFVVEQTASTTTTTDSAADSALTSGLSEALQDMPSAPTGSPVIKATIPEKIIPEFRSYIFTYVSEFGEEGPPSDAAEVVELDPSGDVEVSVPGSPTGQYSMSLKRIYRSSNVGNQTKWQFVDEIPIGTDTYTDSKDQDALGELCPSTNWVAPPAGLAGLRLMANGAAVGFKGKTLYFSEPNLPHAWPNEYTIDDDIVAIGVFGQSVAVLTNGYPYLFQGIDPAAMSSTRLTLPQACVSRRSAVETGDGVIYASPDGLVSIGSSVGVVTQNMMSRDQWQSLTPSSMECYLYNGRVVITHGTTSRGVLILDASGQGAALTTSDVNADDAITAGYYDASRDTLYFAQAGDIVRFDRGDNLTSTWRSKIFRLPRHDNFSLAQVRCAAYPMTLKVYADGSLKHTQVVSGPDHFRLPGGFKALDWEFELIGTNDVHEFTVATSAAELRAV